MAFLADNYRAAAEPSLLSFSKYVGERGGLKTFRFSHCAVDKGENILYAIIKAGNSSNPNDFLVLTSNDLIKLEVSLSEAMSNKASLANPFYIRLEQEIGRALVDMGANQSTLEFVCERDGVDVSDASDQVLKAAGATFG